MAMYAWAIAEGLPVSVDPPRVTVAHRPLVPDEGIPVVGRAEPLAQYAKESVMVPAFGV